MSTKTKPKGPKAYVPPADVNKDGADHDTCVVDRCLDVEPNFRIGGTGRRGAEFLEHSQFFADPRLGGCGANWERSTAQGMAMDAKKGVRSKWPTRSVQVGTHTSIPSNRYRDAYDCAFQKCDCPICGPQWKQGETARCQPECAGHRITYFDFQTYASGVQVLDPVYRVGTDVALSREAVA